MSGFLPKHHAEKEGQENGLSVRAELLYRPQTNSINTRRATNSGFEGLLGLVVLFRFSKNTCTRLPSTTYSPASDGMFAGPNGDFSTYVRAKLKQACLEDWDATMELIFPGTAGAMKRNRALVGEAITGVRSRTRLEQFDVNTLQQCVGILMAFEHRFKLEPQVEEGSLLSLLQLAKEDFRSSGASSQNTTLLELMLKKSVEQVKANGSEVATSGSFQVGDLTKVLA